MNQTDYFAQLQQHITGLPIRYKSLVTNSLLIYANCEPGDDHGYVIWFEPTWHYCNTQRVIAGSRQAQVEEKEAFYAVADLLLPLIGTTIIALELDPITFDLTLRLSDGAFVRSFVSDPTDDETWHISDNAAKQGLYACAKGLRIHSASIR